MFVKDLEKLFSPKSIAVIGASRTVGKIGHVVLKNIIEFNFPGNIYPVNPKADHILKLTCYHSYSEIPETPDLAVICIPAPFVNASLEEIGQKGTRNVVIITAGFREEGPDGQELENEMIAIAERYGINIIGPNCLGFVNTDTHVNTTFGTVTKNPGNLRFISQSGAVATALFDYAAENHLGFSDFITLGNKANTTENDILNFWKTELTKIKHEDQRLSSVTPIGIYTESIDDGMGFINVASQITLENPIFVLKPGRTQAAKSALQSHTGSLAGEDAVTEAAFRDAGIIRANGIEDFFDLAKAFSWEQAPEGPNIAVVTNAGGPAVISTDFVEEEGLHLAEIFESTKARLRKFLPKNAGLHNPIDVLGDALSDRYGEAIDAVLGQNNVDAVIVILTPQVMTDAYMTAQIISRLAKSHNKPILCSFLGSSHVLAGEKILNQNKIPNFRYPERAVKALGKMWKWRQSSVNRALQIKTYPDGVLESNATEINVENIQQVLNASKKRNPDLDTENRMALNSFQVEDILRESSIVVPESTAVKTLQDCLDFTEKYGWPVVLKIISPQLLHKTDIGGVKIGLNNRAKLQNAFNDLKKAIELFEPNLQKTCVIEIQKEVPKGIELIIGIKKDPNFGHVMMFGGGGVFTNLIVDRNLKLLPVDRFNAIEMIRNSKISRLLYGFRDDSQYPISQLLYLMEKMSDLVLNFPEFEEIEINPLIITHEDLWAVDGKAIISI